MKFPTYCPTLLLIGLLCLVLTSCQPPAPEPTAMEDNENTATVTNTFSAYLGTYTRTEGHVDGKASGIYYAEVNAENGALTVKDSTTNIINPSFVKASNDGQLLYAVSETEAGQVFSYRIGKDHRLTMINQLPTGATAPCHIAVDHTDKYVVVSNYMGGIVNVLARDAEGKLSEVQRLELNGKDDNQESHAHSATFSPDNKFVFIMDLGKDRLWGYHFDESTGKLTPADTPFIAANSVGAGPRHFAFAPEGNYAFAINELNSTLTSYTYNATKGLLLEVATQSTLPKGYDGKNSCADVHVHPNGKFVYASNRGHNSIVCFAIGTEGQLSVVGHTSTGGEFPRNFALTPDGKHLLVANQNSSNLLSFQINETTGALTKTGETKVMTPVCIDFVR